MLFKRRSAPTFLQRVKGFFWPRKSFWRSFQYFAKRTLRLTATPHAIAAGIAAGAFASFLPYLGFHFLLAAAIAWCLRGNLVASAIGTAVGNPITFPFIWAGTLAAGRYILYGHELETFAPMQLGRALSHFEFASLWDPLLKPMTVGAIPLGGLCAIILYVFTRWATAAFQKARVEKRAARARSRADVAQGSAVRG
jgi:uncharacterized protein (DUF2062 family)